MRKYLFLFLAVIAFNSIACKKDSSSSNGTLSRDVPAISDVLLTPIDYDSVTKLFQANDILLSGIQPIAIYSDLSDSSATLITHVSARRFVNGLPVSFGSLVYSFSKGKLVDSSASGYLVPETADTTTRLGLTELRKLFLAAKPDRFGLPDKNLKSSTHWADSALLATLMYDNSALYDGSENDSTMIKVWGIHPLNTDVSSSIATIPDKTGVVVVSYRYFLN